MCKVLRTAPDTYEVPHEHVKHINSQLRAHLCSPQIKAGPRQDPQEHVLHPVGEIPMPLEVSREASWGGDRAQSGWEGRTDTWQASPGEQSCFFSLRGLCQGGTHGLDKPVPSRKEMASGPDRLTSCVCPASHQGQIPAQPQCTGPTPLLCFGGFVLVAAKGTRHKTTGGLPLGRAARALGKQVLASRLITLALTGHGWTMGLHGASQKPQVHAPRGRSELGGRRPASGLGFAAMGLCVLGQVLPPSRSSLFLFVK